MKLLAERRGDAWRRPGDSVDFKTAIVSIGAHKESFCFA